MMTSSYMTPLTSQTGHHVHWNYFLIYCSPWLLLLGDQPALPGLIIPKRMELELSFHYTTVINELQVNT